MSLVQLIPAAVRTSVIPCFFAALFLIGGCNTAPSTAPGGATQTSARDATEESLRAAHIATMQREADATYAAWTAGGEVLANNASQRLRFKLSERGVQVRADGAAPWQNSLALQRAGCREQLRVVASAAPQVRGNRIEYQRPGLKEWYVNGPLGLEQGFDVDRPPGCEEGAGLILELALAGDLRPREQERTRTSPQLAFVDTRGRAVLSFGELHAFDADGKTLLAAMEVEGMSVRLRIDDRGARYPLSVDPLIANQQGKLAPADGRLGDGFGYAVAISGDTALVGSWSADLPMKADAGAAYVYIRVAGFWSQQAKIVASDAALGDLFGISVALDGDTAVVGAMSATIGGKMQAGAAYVFTRAGTVWTQQAKLVASDGDTKAFFGISAAVHGDTAVIGADLANVGATVQAGAAYVFTRAGAAWTQQAKLTASDATAQAYFGNAVSFNGQTALIGAYYMLVGGKTFAGAAYVFTRAGTVWTQQARLVAADVGAGDNFGISVSVNADTALVGAYRANVDGKSRAGAAYVFVRAGTAWTQQAKLTGSAPDDNAEFGRSVSIVDNLAVVGAPFPSYIEVTGYAYVFTRDGTTWTQESLVIPNDTNEGSEFGTAVSLSGMTFIVGSILGDSPVVKDTGAAYAIRMSNGKIDGKTCMADAECENAHCIDGVCCNTACGNGSTTDCMACSSGAGAAMNGVCGVVEVGRTCRQAAGDCDLPDSCDGTSTVCPADKFKPSAIVCRAVAGTCDVAENCTGTAAACPADTFKANNTPCRAKADVCDVAEVCTGAAAACPADSFMPSTTECRAANGDCDVAETCTGFSAPCPGNSYKGFLAPCRPVAGPCDAAETCTGNNPNCPVDLFRARGATCRPAAGDCDVAETCNGGEASCPTDLFKPSTFLCRASSGACDATESCTGSSASCPEDAMKPQGTECRAAAGGCDVAETCSGSEPSCPPDQLKSSTAICRPAAGLCDAPETCSGTSEICPKDDYQPRGFECRAPSTQGDPPEICGGTTADCPPDVPAVKTEPPRDGAMSTGCQMGAGASGPGTASAIWLCAVSVSLLIRRRRLRQDLRGTV